MVPLLSKVTTREPTTNPGRFSMASTVSAASEGTYEIEFTPSPIKKKIDAYSIVSGRRRRESVHTVPSHSASVRSGGGSTVVAARLARLARLTSASGQIAEEAHSIRSKSGISHRSTRASASGRDMRSKPVDGNDSRGGSGHVLAQSTRSSGKSRMSRSHRSQTNRPPAVITLDTTSSHNTPSLTSTSSSFYTSSTPSTHFDPSLFNAELCNELVELFLLRIIKLFNLDLETEGQHLDLLEDELANTYRDNQELSEEQIGAAMEHIYYAHSQILHFALSRVPVQPSALNNDNDALPNNLEIDAVIPPPQDDARTARRAARNQAAAPDGGPGDGDDDDGSDEDNNNNNPGGNGRGNGNGNGNNNPPPPPPPIPPAPPAANNAGAGDGNDPPPPGDGADVENEDDDDEDEEGTYNHADIALPDGFNLQNFDYNDECRLVRRVFWLCGIPDHMHGPLMVLGGLNSFKKIAKYSQSTWKDIQKAAARWRPQVTLHKFHLDLLAGVSLWVLVKIVLGEERSAALLTKEELLRISTSEICEHDEDPDSVPPTLNHLKQYAQWKKSMVAYLDTKRSKDGLKLSYVVRGSSPATYTSLQEELHHLVSVDGSTAEYRRDRKFIFSILDTSINESTSRIWLESNNNRKNHDGRGVWLQLQRIGEGNDNREVCIQEFQDTLETCKYKGFGQCNAKKTVARLIETYQSLSEHNIEYSELDKLRHLRNHMLVSGEMAKDYWINDWEKDVTTAIRHNTELGTPVVFIDWTTRLINGEADYFKKLKKKNTTISSTNRGPGNGNSGNGNASGGQQASGGGSSAWKPSGEPKEATIHKIDITVLYGNVSKLEQTPWSTLPKVTRQWFIDNPSKPCPAKFKSNSNSNSKSKYKSNNNSNKKTKFKRQVSSTEADGAENADDVDNDELSSNTDS